MHVGYALIVAATIVRHGRRPLARILATLYAPFVLLAIVATGNHLSSTLPPARSQLPLRRGPLLSRERRWRGGLHHFPCSRSAVAALFPARPAGEFVT
jgi:hypothetical protein